MAGEVDLRPGMRAQRRPHRGAGAAPGRASGQVDVRPDIGAERHPRPVDAAIAALAVRQHGVVARRQLVALGLGRRAIGHRLEQGRLHRVHRGVYAVGHPLLTRHGRWLAAVLAVEGAVLSHRAAGSLWGIRPSDLIEVTAGRAVRPRAGIRIREATLRADEVCTHEGILVTTPARTLLDLAAILNARDLERAANEAEVRRLASPTSLDALVARYPGRPGTPAVKELLATQRIGANITKEELEHRFLAFLDERGIPRPQTNADLALHDGTWIKPDCLWRQAKLIVELDGGATHHTRRAFERDRARDRKAVVSGHRVIRITWRSSTRTSRAWPPSCGPCSRAKYPRPTQP
jgi:Transcriptional regulator, AbiEi antitoxin